MRRSGIHILLALVGVLLTGTVAGCGSSHPPGLVRSSFVEFTPEQRQEIQSRGGQEYRIQEGDILKIAFSYQKDLNQEGVVVLGDGSVNLIGVDRVKVAGYTMTEVDSMLTQAYSREYIDPALSVLMQETRGRRVYVLGEVRNPGMHHVPAGGIDMLGAISVAGGFTDDAAPEGAVLVRITDEGFLAQEVDLSNMGDVSAIGLAMVNVQAHDVVYVPRSRVGNFGYFARNVLIGLAQITRIASDITYISGGNIGIGRF